MHHFRTLTHKYVLFVSHKIEQISFQTVYVLRTFQRWTLIFLKMN
jgi:hypothetical protein